MRRAGQLAAARDALSSWDIEVAAVDFVSESENIAFRVEDGYGRVYVLRLHRPWYHSYEELLSEQVWTAVLRDGGADVPVPVPTHEGEAYARARIGNEDRWAGLLEWVDGVPMAELLDTDAGSDRVRGLFEALGALIATLHNHAAGWTPPEAFARHSLDEDGLLGEAPWWGRFWESRFVTGVQGERLDGLRRRIYDLLRGYGKGPDRFSMIHADLHPGNVIVNGARMHVIDFDDAGFGWHAYDLAVALFRYQTWGSFGEIRTALVEGYRRVRSLDKESVDMIGLFLFVRALVSIGWISARPELERQEYGPWLVEHVFRNVDRVEAVFL
ncbi:MAG: phosphotransferase enzyme family protein [Dehalococcoidia bacterium]